MLAEKRFLPVILEENKDVKKLVDELGLAQVSDTAMLEKIADEV